MSIECLLLKDVLVALGDKGLKSITFFKDGSGHIEEFGEELLEFDSLKELSLETIETAGKSGGI